jgi:hypothetical protein
VAEFPVNDEDIKALRLQILRALAVATYPKEAIGPLAAKHGYPDKAEMARRVIELSGSVPAIPRPLPPAPGNTRSPGGPLDLPRASNATTPGSVEPPNLTHGTLLVAGEKSPKARTRRLAARIRAELAELRGLVQLLAEVKKLEEELAAKKAALRTPVKKAAASDNAAIRAWAAAKGIECTAFGRVPAAVREAYEAAQGAA